MKVERIPQIDFLKGLAILGVVLIHTTPGGTFRLGTLSLDQLYFIVANKLTRFAVPFFIILSGHLLYEKHRAPPFNYLTFVRRRFGYLIPPYLVFTLIYYYTLHLQKGEEPNSTAFLNMVLTGEAAPHLYFVVLLIQLYLLFPIFRWIAYSIEAKGPLAELAFLLLLGTVTIRGVSRYGLLSLGFPTFIPVSHYFLLGCLTNMNLNLISKRGGWGWKEIGLLLSISSLYLLLDTTFLKGSPYYREHLYTFYYPGITLYSYLLLLYLWRSIAIQGMDGLWTQLLRRMGRASYTIYLIHFLFVTALEGIAPFPRTSALHSVTLAIGVIGTTLLTIIWLEDPLTARLTGMRYFLHEKPGSRLK